MRISVMSRDSCPKRTVPLWGPPSLLVHGYWGSVAGIKRARRDVDLSIPSLS
jgi:hypothetical protein